MEVILYSEGGEIVFQEKVNSDNWITDITQQPSGIYFLKIMVDGKVESIKLLKN